MNSPMKLPRLFRPWFCPTMVRLGKDHDGGYLVNPRDVTQSTRLLSLGIGDDTSFEVDFRALNPCEIHSYDHTVDQVDQADITHHSTKVGSGGMGVAQLLSPGEHDVFLKCDIEGSEYDILDDLIQVGRQFSGMVIEVHTVHDPERFDAVTNFLAKLPMALIHVHANNNSYIQTPEQFVPDCLELTFTSDTNLHYWGAPLPHPLDQPNAASRPDFAISFT